MRRGERRQLRALQVALEVLLGRMSRSAALEVRAHLPVEAGRFALAALPLDSRFSPYEEFVEAIASRRGSGLGEAEGELRAAVKLLAGCLPPSLLMRACAELRGVFRRVLNEAEAAACAVPASPVEQPEALPLASAPPSGGDPYIALRRRHALDDWY